MTKKGKEKKTTSVIDDIRRPEDKKSDLGDAIYLLLNDLFRRRKTVIKRDIVGLLTSLDVIAQIYDVTFLKTWIPQYCEYLTSVNGMGRKDIVEMIKFGYMQREKENERIFELLGRR